MRILLYGFLLFICSTYSLLVGKYQLFPYSQISTIYHSFSSSIGQNPLVAIEKQSPVTVKARERLHELESSRKALWQFFPTLEVELSQLIYSHAPKKLTSIFSLPTVAVYSDKISYIAGDKIEFKIHSEEKSQITVYRLGVKKYVKRTEVNPSVTKQPNRFNNSGGLDWRTNYVLDTADYDHGLYLLEVKGLQTGTINQTPFILKNEAKVRVVLLASTYTWSGFNNFGGLSFYENRHYNDEDLDRLDLLNSLLSDSKLPPVPLLVPFRRPTVAEAPVTEEMVGPNYYSHLLRGFWEIVSFVEREKIPYSVMTDDDFANLFDKPNKAQLEFSHLVIGPHSEYWSQDMLNSFQQFLKLGGKGIIAGGNTSFFKVKKEDGYLIRLGHFELSELSQLFMTSIQELAYPKYAPFTVRKADHWVFKNTGVSNGSKFGLSSANHDGESKSHGASGWEADQLIDSNSGEIDVLATGDNDSGQADMVFKDFEPGGWLFNASSIPFAGSLRTDSVARQMVLNLLEN